MGKSLITYALALAAWGLRTSAVRAHHLRAFLVLAALGSGLPTSPAQDVRTFVPLGAATYAPILAVTQKGTWPEVPEPFTLAGQVEQESCISLRHSRCWNPRAELKTSREYGFGFGQITTAYKADGSVRFNKFEELRAAYPSLAGWAWNDRYKADFQLKALVELDRTLFNRLADVPLLPDRWAMTLAAYNGGLGGVLQDRRLCSNTAGCDSTRWWGNAERTSLKTRRVNAGYGKSAFEINREYPHLILQVRRDKYRAFWT